MADLLVRDVPDDVVAAIDAHAKRLRLSRSEYLRRELLRAAAVTAQGITTDDLSWFGQTFCDLGKPEVMAQAWR